MAKAILNGLFDAIKKGDVPVFKMCVQRIGHRLDYLNARNSEGYTALHLSCLNSHIGFVRWLVDLGVDTEIKSKEECWTALHCACITSSKQIVIFLLNSFANPFVSDKQGYKPIDVAIKSEIKGILRKHMEIDSRKESIVESKYCDENCRHEEYCQVTRL